MSGDDYDFDEDGPDDDDYPNETIPCHNCGEEVFEDAVQCCHCGEYGPADGPRRRIYPQRPMWFWVAGLIGTLAVIFTLLGGAIWL